MVLPPEQAPSRPPAVPVADLADALELTAARAARVWTGATGAREMLTARFAHGVEPGTVRARSRASTGLDDSPLGVLTTALEADGWTCTHPPGDVARVVAHLDGSEILASYAGSTGTFVLTVSSAPRAVGPEHARELVRG